MRLFEGYFADIDALNDARIAELRKYHEETSSLVKYYYMDIPKDVCEGIEEFNNKFSIKLLGSKWYDNLSDIYEGYKNENWDTDEKHLKSEYEKRVLTTFYEEMDNGFQGRLRYRQQDCQSSNRRDCWVTVRERGEEVKVDVCPHSDVWVFI